MVVVHTLVVQAVLVALVVGPRLFGVEQLVQLPLVPVLVQQPVQALEQPLRKINYLGWCNHFEMLKCELCFR